MNDLRKNDIATLILCGGKSSRMGKDKALLEFQGIPLLRKMALIGLECTSQVWLIAPNAATYQSILPSGCRWLVEQTPNQGPLLAFAQGLAQLNTEWVFLLACDLPLLTPELVRGWVDYLDGLPREILALVPHQGGYWHPLCGFYRRLCDSKLQAFVAGGGTSFQAWLDAAWVQVLPLEDPQVISNCNTPEDWQRLHYLSG